MTREALWPDPAQVLLLKAGLDEGEAALDAFERWAAVTDLDGHLDGGSFRLLPLVYANLSRAGCGHPLMGRLRGVYRHSWCEAQARRVVVAEAVERLTSRGVPVLVTKGLALAEDYYESPALRPMSDMDFTVTPDRAREAMAALREGGWAPQIYRNWVGREADMMVLISQVICRHETRGEIDLHWRTLAEVSGDEVDERFWAGARAFSLGGRDVLRPSPTDLLFHVVVHGMRYNKMPPLRWIADAAMILRRDGPVIDWADMMAFARRVRVSYRLALGLAYLRDTLGADIPDLALNAPAPSLTERIENVLLLQDATQQAESFRTLAERIHKVFRLMDSPHRRHVPRLGVRFVARRLGVWSRA
jgi:hypothetical protein